MTRVGEDAEKGETLLHCWWGKKAGAATPEDSIEVPQKVENRATL